MLNVMLMCCTQWLPKRSLMNGHPYESLSPKESQPLLSTSLISPHLHLSSSHRITSSQLITPHIISPIPLRTSEHLLLKQILGHAVFHHYFELCVYGAVTCERVKILSQNVKHWLGISFGIAVQKGISVAFVVAEKQAF